LKDEGVSGGVVAGDMNAISPSDKDLHVQFGLRDAWWRKSAADAEDGYTWGYQGGGNFPKSRMDKFLFLPQKGFRLEEPQRIGVDVKTDGVWVSDHYGLSTRLHVL
jgi:tyrosyl-DNA phosphodiesterase 2